MPGLLDYIPSQSDVQRTLADLLSGSRNRLADLMPRGLLGAARQYISDAAPGGVLNAEWTPENVRTAGEVASMMPNPAGDVISGLLAVDDLRKGDYGSAALNGLGLVPFIPAMSGMLKFPLGRIPETRREIDYLADMLKRHGGNALNRIEDGASNVSASRYITFKRGDLDLPDLQVRISNHGDMYPSQFASMGERFSVDPRSGNTYEEAVNWLKDNGVHLSTKKRIPPPPDWVKAKPEYEKVYHQAMQNLYSRGLDMETGDLGSEIGKILGIQQ